MKFSHPKCLFCGRREDESLKSSPFRGRTLSQQEDHVHHVCSRHKDRLLPESSPVLSVSSVLHSLLKEGGFHVNVGEKSVFPRFPAPLSTCVGPLHHGPSRSLQNA